MWTILDTIGASVIGASIIFMVLALNMQMNHVSNQITVNNLIQSHYTTSMEILDYDIHKMGYRVNDDIVLVADSLNLKYCVDLADSGRVDTVFYNAHTSDADSIGNDIYLDRQVNSEDPENVGIVSAFNMSYFDSLGNTINYAALETATNRAKIRTIEIQLELTVQWEDTTGYNDVNWRVRVQPKNLLSRE